MSHKDNGKAAAWDPNLYQGKRADQIASSQGAFALCTALLVLALVCALFAY